MGEGALCMGLCAVHCGIRFLLMKCPVGNWLRHVNEWPVYKFADWLLLQSWTTHTDELCKLQGHRIEPMLVNGASPNFFVRHTRSVSCSAFLLVPKKLPWPRDRWMFAVSVDDTIFKRLSFAKPVAHQRLGLLQQVFAHSVSSMWFFHHAEMPADQMEVCCNTCSSKMVIFTFGTALNSTFAEIKIHASLASDQYASWPVVIFDQNLDAA